MRYVPLGKSGLTSSILGLGGGSSGRFGLTKGGTRADAIRLIQTALDLGITFFDGAGISGGVDELLASGLGNRRPDVLLSTKIHLGPDPFAIPGMRLANRASSWAARRFGMVCDGAALRDRVERTLKALRTDRIDVLHLHAVSPRQYPLAVEQALPVLRKMKEEGKLRAIGITEGFLTDPGHAMLQAAVGDAFVDVIMVGFNPGNASAALCVLPQAKTAGIGTIGMFALRGLRGHSAASKIHRIAEEAGCTLSELAYRFCGDQAGLDIVLTGTGNPAHLEQNVAAMLAPPLPALVQDRLRALSVLSTAPA